MVDTPRQVPGSLENSPEAVGRTTCSFVKPSCSREGLETGPHAAGERDIRPWDGGPPHPGVSCHHPARSSAHVLREAAQRRLCPRRPRGLGAPLVLGGSLSGWELNPSLISSSRHRPTREGSGLGVFPAPPHAQESAWFLTRVGEQISAPSPLLASLWPTPPHGQARSAWERALAREAVGTIT